MASAPTNLVCHIALGEQLSGPLRQLELLVRGLAEWGCKQRLAAHRNGALPQRLRDVAGLEIRKISGSSWSVMRAARDAALVHLHEDAAVRAYGLARRFNRAPVVISRRDLQAEPRASAVYKTAAAVVAAAPVIAERLAAALPGTDITVIPTAASAYMSYAGAVRRIRERYSERYLVGVVARLDQTRSALDEVIEAARELGRTHSRMHFLLVGDGPDSGRYEQAVAQVSNVTVLPPPDNFGDYLKAFDVLLLPARHSLFNGVILDAMDLNCPVVATRVPGVQQMVRDGVNGLLYEAANSDQLRYALVRLHDDPALSVRLADAARAGLDEFSPERMVERYLQLYQPLFGADALTVDNGAGRR